VDKGLRQSSSASDECLASSPEIKMPAKIAGIFLIYAIDIVNTRR
jgi:hypothetical protein